MLLKKLHLEKKEVAAFVVMLLTILVVTGLPFLVNGLGCFFSDLMYHLLRIESVKDALLNGVFPSRINELFFNGYGYGSSLFYPDVFLIFPALLRMIGITPLLTWKLFALCITALATCSTYFSFKYIVGKWQYSVVGTFLLMCSQFFLSDLINRAGISEYLAFIFMPLLYVGIYDYFAKEGKKTCLIGVAFAGLVLSHTIMTFIALLLTVVTFVVAFFFKNTRKAILNGEKIKRLLITAVITVLAVAYYVFPMIEQMASGEFKYSTPWTYVGNNVQPVEVLFYPVGDFNVIAYHGIGIPILALLSCRVLLGKVKNRWADVFLIQGIFIFFITTEIIPWHYLNETIFNMIQFTYRFYPYALFSVILGIVLVLAEKCVENRKQVCILAIGMALVFGVWQNWDFAVNDITGAVNEDFLYENSNFVGQGEWLPVSVTDDVRNLAATDKVLTANGEIPLVDAGYNQYRFEVPEGQEHCVLPLIYYKGYSATLHTAEGEEISLPVTQSEDGLVLVTKAETEAGLIEVEYSGTVIQTISNITTLLVLGSLAGCLVWKIKRKSIKKSTCIVTEK